MQKLFTHDDYLLPDATEYRQPVGSLHHLSLHIHTSPTLFIMLFSLWINLDPHIFLQPNEFYDIWKAYLIFVFSFTA